MKSLSKSIFILEAIEEKIKHFKNQQLSNEVKL